MTLRISARVALRALLLCLGLAGATLLVVACAPLALINSLVPADTYTLTRDQAYGEHPRQRLDVYVPARPAPAGAGLAPVIVFFYGGAWTSGSRADYRFVGEAFASRGFVAVIADYRLYPEVKFPLFLEDSADAVAWAARHAARFGGDPGRIYIAGHSAGAYNAAMLVYAPQYLARAGIDAAAIRGMIGLAGPYDFLPATGATTRAIFGHPDTPPETQPIHFVGRAPGMRLAPALLLTAPQDTTVNPANSARMAVRLRGAGAGATEVSYPSLDHQRIVGALAAPLRNLAPVLDDIARFVDTQP
jgi:acetyl esterase/lipase